jgi:protein TonB
VSALGHVVLAIALAVAVLLGGWKSSKVYVVNLVPSIAAVGSPSGRTEAPPAPKPSPPAPQLPTPPRPAPAPREAVAPEPVKQLPSASLPRPQLPTRPAALPRPGDKDLPPLATPSERRAPVPAAAKPADTAAEARPAPPVPRGQITGSVTGTGALTLDVSDFPHAWYLRQILQKVEAEWQRQAHSREPELKPLVLVEIQRDGSIRTPRIEKSSGNALYDQAALRAVVQASPFPPLPEDWTKPALRVMFRFDLARG